MLHGWRMVLVSLALLPACTGPGGLSAGATTPDGGATSPDTGPPASAELAPLPDRGTVPGPVPLRRLTILEYNNTVRDLVGARVAPVFTRDQLGPDQNFWSSFSRGATVSSADDARRLMLSAEEIAASVLQDLPALLPCAAAPATPADEDACADELIARIGLRAFRRPLDAHEVDKLRALYRRQRAPELAGTFKDAIGDVLVALLEAPEFLYRWEVGPRGALREGMAVRFDGYELASRLSYLFWASMPDEALFTAAADGKLGTTTQLVAQARRLLADGRAAVAIEEFHQHLVEADDLEDLQKDASFRDYTPALARALVQETRAFAASVFVGAQADGKLTTLLSSTTAFLDGPLARFYGVPEPAGPTGSGTLPREQRAGLFTRAAFLASHADGSEDNPVRRGDTVLRRLMCLSMPEPADIAIPDIRPPPVNATVRQRFEAHGANACAVECHQKIVDPIGYAFEHYDAVGAWRTTDNGLPVDSHATIVLPSERIEFDDAIALSALLARRKEVHDCMSTQWLRNLLGREEVAGERPSLEALADDYRRNDDLRELMVALVRTKTFTHRAVSPGEVSP